MADRRHEVSLAEADPAVDEQRVVFLPGLIGDRQRRSMGKLVGRSYDELREAVSRVQRGMPVSARRGGRRRSAVRSGGTRLAVAVCIAMAVAIAACVTTISVGMPIIWALLRGGACAVA